MITGIKMKFRMLVIANMSVFTLDEYMIVFTLYIYQSFNA
jgi:hypothetical protein